MNTHTRRDTHTSSVGRAGSDRSPYAPTNPTSHQARPWCVWLLTPLVTAAVGMALITVITAIAMSTPDPTALVRPLSVAALGVASLVGGVVAGKRSVGSEDARNANGTRAAVLGGLVSGLLWAALLALISVLLPGGTVDPPLPAVLPWLMRLGAVALHTIGAYIARPRPRMAVHTAAPTGKHPSHRH